MGQGAANKFENIFKENSDLADFLRQNHKFRVFDEELLTKLVSVSCTELISPNAILLKQGGVSDKIFILLSGSLEVEVDEEVIATLKRKGDIIGEMSFITGLPCSATIRAVEDCEVLRIEYSQLEKMDKEEQAVLQQAFDRLFSSILAEKLSITNEKAKQFEVINRQLSEANDELEKSKHELELKVEERTSHLREKSEELLASYQELEQKNTVLQASMNRLEEATATKDKVLETLTVLNHSFIGPLKSSLEKIGKKGAKDSQTELVSAIRGIAHISERLKPLEKLYQSEQAIQSKKVLLCENDRSQQINARMALRGTGVELDIVEELEDGIKHLEQNQYDVICSSSELIDCVAVAHELNPEIKSVFLTTEDTADYLKIIRKIPYLSNIVSLNENEKIFNIKNISATVKKLVTGELFGLEKYLNWGVEIKTQHISRSDEREKSIDEMLDYFRDMGIRRQMLNKYGMIAEEMLMNAIYDAPVDAEGKPLFNKLDRTNIIELKPDQRATLRYACDGVFAAIAVEDPFGAFKKETILDYLENCYSDSDVTLNEGDEEKGGGGFGLFQIMKKSDLIVINVKDKLRTEVIALCHVDKEAAKDMKTASFHYFYS